MHARLEAGEPLEPSELERSASCNTVSIAGLLCTRFDGGSDAARSACGTKTWPSGRGALGVSGGAALARRSARGRPGTARRTHEPSDLDALEGCRISYGRVVRHAHRVARPLLSRHTVSGVWHLSNKAMTRWPGNNLRSLMPMGRRRAAGDSVGRRSRDPRQEEFIRRIWPGKNQTGQEPAQDLDKLERIDRPRESDAVPTAPALPARRPLVLEARGLEKSFGARRLFSHLDVELARGDIFGFVGPNGAGKTTLLKILAGKTRPDAGTVRLGADIDLGYFDQELDFVGDSPSLLEEIWRMDRTQSEEQVRSCLGAFGFGAEFVDRPVRVLSGGQRNRLGLLKLVLTNRNFLVLDEPTNHLDLDAVAVLEEALRDFEGTLLMVSHDRLLLSRAVRKLIVIAGGHCRMFHGGYEEYVQSLGGAPLWSEIAAYEAERAARQATLVPAGRAPNGKGARDEAETNASTASSGPASKNTLARLRKRLDELENDIASLEVDLEELEQALAQAHTLRPEEIEAAARQHADAKKQLDARYADWDTLSQELEAKKGGK